MGKRKCGCVIADSNNTSSVRRGFELGGYVKHFCKKHGKPDPEEYKEVSEVEQLHQQLTTAQSENEALKAANRDLQDWFNDARAAAEKAQARVAVQFDALTSVAVALKDAGNLTKEMHDLIVAATDGSSEAVLLRKQAEAAEEAIVYALRTAGNVDPFEVNIHKFANDYAQRLRQQALDLEAGGR